MQEEKNWKIKNWHRFSICNFEEWPTDRVLYVITKWFTKFSYPWCSAKNTWLHFQNGYKTMKEKCRYGERFLYFSHCCDACLLNSALDEQANYCSSNSLICPNFLVDLQEISGGSWSLVLRRCGMLRVVEGEFIQDLMSKVELFSSNIWRNLRRCETIWVSFRANFVSKFVRT